MKGRRGGGLRFVRVGVRKEGKKRKSVSGRLAGAEEVMEDGGEFR